MNSVRSTAASFPEGTEHTGAFTAEMESTYLQGDLPSRVARHQGMSAFGRSSRQRPYESTRSAAVSLPEQPAWRSVSIRLPYSAREAAHTEAESSSSPPSQVSLDIHELVMGVWLPLGLFHRLPCRLKRRAGEEEEVGEEYENEDEFIKKGVRGGPSAPSGSRSFVVMADGRGFKERAAEQAAETLARADFFATLFAQYVSSKKEKEVSVTEYRIFCLALWHALFHAVRNASSLTRDGVWRGLRLSNASSGVFSAEARKTDAVSQDGHDKAEEDDGCLLLPQELRYDPLETAKQCYRSVGSQDRDDRSSSFTSCCTLSAEQWYETMLRLAELGYPRSDMFTQTLSHARPAELLLALLWCTKKYRLIALAEHAVCRKRFPFVLKTIPSDRCVVEGGAAGLLEKHLAQSTAWPPLTFDFCASKSFAQHQLLHLLHMTDGSRSAATPIASSPSFSPPRAPCSSTLLARRALGLKKLLWTALARIEKGLCERAMWYSRLNKAMCLVSTDAQTGGGGAAASPRPIQPLEAFLSMPPAAGEKGKLDMERATAYNEAMEGLRWVSKLPRRVRDRCGSLQRLGEEVHQAFLKEAATVCMPESAAGSLSSLAVEPWGSGFAANSRFFCASMAPLCIGAATGRGARQFGTKKHVLRSMKEDLSDDFDAGETTQGLREIRKRWAAKHCTEAWQGKWKAAQRRRLLEPPATASHLPLLEASSSVDETVRMNMRDHYSLHASLTAECLALWKTQRPERSATAAGCPQTLSPLKTLWHSSPSPAHPLHAPCMTVLEETGVGEGSAFREGQRLRNEFQWVLSKREPERNERLLGFIGQTKEERARRVLRSLYGLRFAERPRRKDGDNGDASRVPKEEGTV